MCALRATKELADTATITNSEGGVSRHKSSEKGGTHGKPAKWCDLSGTINSKPYGLAIFDHPENPRHPTLWETRAFPGYGLIWVNPCQKESLTVEKGKTVTFRYRVVVHAGDAKAANLEAKYQQYVKP